ncbi:hypothetical protein CRENBAI_004456 [Crenichthys baileyi]|uniref:Uncharacterized protein n=1 Tax=Crenichthys baileyi TaxID=28760 RepID=A0AAV9RKS2_9TELE
MLPTRSLRGCTRILVQACLCEDSATDKGILEFSCCVLIKYNRLFGIVRKAMLRDVMTGIAAPIFPVGHFQDESLRHFQLLGRTRILTLGHGEVESVEMQTPANHRVMLITVYSYWGRSCGEDEVGRRRQQTDSLPWHTFNVMNLGDHVNEFRGVSLSLSATAHFDHQWYKVQGITKTLDTVSCYRKHTTVHNMITMDIVRRILEDLSADTMPPGLGARVGPMSRLVLTQLKALLLTPLCAGVRVAGIPSPDMFSLSSSYTYHNICLSGCDSIRDTCAVYTEVDLVTQVTFRNNIVLFKLKANDVLDNYTQWRYNSQLWLTWIMFSLN